MAIFCDWVHVFTIVATAWYHIHHTLFDSALQSPLKRMFQPRSELFYDDPEQGDEPEESNFDNPLERFVSTGCCAHDIQKSMRWASSGLISAQGLIDMHICRHRFEKLISVVVRARAPVHHEDCCLRQPRRRDG